MVAIQNICTLFLSTICLSKAAAVMREDSMLRQQMTLPNENAALVPVTLAAIPLVLPMLTKFALTVSVSGIAYMAMFVTWIFSNGMHTLSRSLDIDDEDSQMSRATRAVKRALSTVEEAVTGGTPDCRRRIVCEISRSVSTAVPRSFEPEGFVMSYLRNQSTHNDTYLGAWASGWLKLDCVDLYACDRFSVDRVSSVFRSMGGSHGYISDLFEKVGNATAAAVSSTTVKVLSSTETPTFVSNMVGSVFSKSAQSNDDFGSRFGLW